MTLSATLEAALIGQATKQDVIQAIDEELSILKNGFTSNEHYHVISARPEYDTQHIALVGSVKPLCGSKIAQVHEVSLKLGYLCGHCAKKVEFT